MNSPSIKRRLLLASSLLVLGFTAVAAWSLSAAFEEQAESALRERAQTHIYTLLASAQEDAQGRLRIPRVLADPLFNQPDSGTYALIEGEHGDYHWRSGSLLGRQLPAPGPLASGSTRHSRMEHLLVVDQAITWDDYEGQPVPYRLRVALDTSALEAQQRDFRYTLWLWLGALGLLLLGVQLVAVRWGLKPLGDIARDIRRIEQGERDALSQDLPVETRPLVDAINTLLEQSHRRQARVRHSLADLAHSLKTPLSILRGATHEIRDTQQAALIGEQVDRIDEIIRYQRQKAIVSGARALLPPVAVRPVAQRLGQSLHKLNSNGSIDFQLDVPEDFSLRMEPGSAHGTRRPHGTAGQSPGECLSPCTQYGAYRGERTRQAHADHRG